jgi:putative flippase GtrA
MVILIPAYEPDERFLDLLDGLTGHRIVVVDDGSGPGCEPIFRKAAARGCMMITHPRNRGKGAALKTGFAAIAAEYPGEDIVTADCDGQHAVPDIIEVGNEVRRRTNTIVLGSRRFVGKVPFRSRVGNTVTRFVFGLSTGLRLLDTQTGLRGYPSVMLDWLQRVEGDRFEYEFVVLLRARAAGYAVHEVPVETIYLDGNRSSHFRPVVDSARIYGPLVRFSLSSMAAALLDFLLLFVLNATTGSLLVSVVGARVSSSVFNYTTNRTFVFGTRARTSPSAVRYFALVGALLAANYGLMHLLNETLGVALLIAKVGTEGVLFTLSYQIQKRFVFAVAGRRPARDNARLA